MFCDERLFTKGLAGGDDIKGGHVSHRSRDAYGNGALGQQMKAFPRLTLAEEGFAPAEASSTTGREDRSPVLV